MKRVVIFATVATALVLVAGAAEAFAQATFKIPFPFQIASVKLPKGEYRLTQMDETHLALKQEATGKEFQISFTKRLAQPSPPLAEPHLVFNVVGDFAPSYTEYVTDYVVAEAWLPGTDGFLFQSLKGAHKTQILKGQKAE